MSSTSVDLWSVYSIFVRLFNILTGYWSTPPIWTKCRRLTSRRWWNLLNRVAATLLFQLSHMWWYNQIRYLFILLRSDSPFSGFCLVEIGWNFLIGFFGFTFPFQTWPFFSWSNQFDIDWSFSLPRFHSKTSIGNVGLSQFL